MSAGDGGPLSVQGQSDAMTRAAYNLARPFLSRDGPPVCTENLNPHIVVMKSAKDCV